MRRALALLTTAVAIGWSVAAPAPAAASCAEVVVWHDTAYFPYATSGRQPHPAPGVRLPGAVAPGCNDTGGDPPPPTRVDARAIAGVPPGVALRFGHAILVAPGYFPQVRGFPIRWRRVDDGTATCQISGALTLAGRAQPTPGVLTLRARRLIDLVVDVHTRFAGLERNGLPYVGDGQAVRIEAVRCGAKIVARRISAAGPHVPETSAEDILGADWRGGPSIVTSTERNHWWAAGGAAVTVALAGGVLVVRRRPRASHRG